MVRGRGYSSRGGGRGNSYRSSGSTYNRIGGSRKPDFHESGYRGGNSRYNSGGYNSYDSRNRDKFQSRYETRHDGKRSYRDSSRDRSDDRKRPRQEDSRLSSNYASTSSYRNRNDTSRNRLSSPSGNYQGRGSSSAYHRGQREDSAGRRHATANDSMGPPKRQIRSSYVVRPRGSGTASRVRGSGTARGGMRVIRKESTDMRIMRRKLLLARQRDRARLIKIARLTSSLRKRKGPRSSESPSGRKSRDGDKKSDNEEEEEDEDEEVEEEAEEEESGKAKEKRDKKKAKSSGKKVTAGGDDEEGDEAGKDGVQSDKEDDEEDEDENDNDEEKAAKKDEEAMDEDTIEVEDDETKEGKSTSEDKSNGADGAAESEKDTKDASKEKKSKERKEDSNKDSRRKRTSKSPPRRPKFIKLTCVHCRMNCVTFKEYTSHLYSRMHKMAMRRVAIRQRVTLARMRNQQRNAQREIEEKSKDDLDEVKPQFCLLCRLNYRQPKAKHQLSEHHKDMKKFLMPYCQTCHLAFKSPMLYEAHRCSLEHIRRKARSNEANSDVSGDDEEKEVDLKNFMTVDSVGEIDDLDDEELENHLNEDPTLSNKEKVPVGSQYIKKVEAFYCELCRTYNGLKEDEESYIKQHCGSRSHLKAFLRHREDENLQAKAERAEKKDKKKEASESEKKTETAEDVEEAGEDKLWEDVDKDLGDLLREVGPDEHDEEEEEEEDESVLNIDIESEKTKPSKEVNGKKEETPTPATEVEVATKKETTTPVVKVKKEKLEAKANIKTQAINKDKEKKAESSTN